MSIRSSLKQQAWAGIRTWIVVTAVTAAACGRANDAATLMELQRVKSGALDVALLSPRDALRHGKDTFIIEFRSTSGASLVDVGNVRGSATMPMPGVPMMGGIDVKRTEVAGRYAADSNFEMAGTWRVTLQWEGPAGQGSVTFPGTVQ